MLARELEPKIKELSKNGNIVYSISKINSFNQCEFGYYQTYIKGNRGMDNIYSISGSNFHSSLQEIYDGKKTEEILINTLNDLEIEMGMLGIKFPNDKIKNSWTADMQHFCKNFKKEEGKYITEEGILFNVFDNVWIQGYCDLQIVHNEQTLSIIDFKTSSKFDKHKLLEAGRQLILYAYAKELQGYKIKLIAWNMLKYCYISWQLKNGKINKKMCSRKKWVEEIKNPLEKDLLSIGLEEFEVQMKIDEAIKNNNLNNLPKTIQNKYTLSDCILEYPYIEELKQELLDYIKLTHEKIMAKDVKNESEWKPVNLNDKNSFFSINLCNHKRTCPYLREYLQTKDFVKKEKPIDELEELFG